MFIVSLLTICFFLLLYTFISVDFAEQLLMYILHSIRDVMFKNIDYYSTALLIIVALMFLYLKNQRIVYHLVVVWNFLFIQSYSSLFLLYVYLGFIIHIKIIYCFVFFLRKKNSLSVIISRNFALQL